VLPSQAAERHCWSLPAADPYPNPRRGRGTAVDSGASMFYDAYVNSTIAAPVDWIEAVGNLRFPSKADHRLQELMDRNNEGLLQESEREELEALVELSERLSLVRGAALQILGKQPK